MLVRSAVPRQAPCLPHRLSLQQVESVAQLVEHRPFKALVLGSSPSALTTSHPHHFEVPSIIFLTMFDVEKPGTVGTISTRPPAAITS